MRQILWKPGKKRGGDSLQIRFTQTCGDSLCVFFLINLTYCLISSVFPNTVVCSHVKLCESHHKSRAATRLFPLHLNKKLEPSSTCQLFFLSFSAHLDSDIAVLLY